MSHLVVIVAAMEDVLFPYYDLHPHPVAASMLLYRFFRCPRPVVAGIVRSVLCPYGFLIDFLIITCTGLHMSFLLQRQN
ncbi:unnamed protein product [Amoebophrya sp. A25]|nr:unnamed protein product [Amoebophrya sp. A25]|eukprot:GSA25T00013949001.1